MMKILSTKYTQVISMVAVLVITACILPSCRKFVELDAPQNQVGVEQSFETDATATSAVLGIYNNGSVRTWIFNLSVYPGMSADDVQSNFSQPAQDEFENNALSISNSSISNILWAYGYASLAQANIMIAGLGKSTSLTPAVKNQLMGEAKTWRAFDLFYLANLFGDVPMPVSDDALANAVLPRTPVAQVWQQIITDLKEAQQLLPETYPTALRARINRHTATALLARAYLYTKDWAAAEAAANTVISSGVYSLNKDLNTTFSNTSNEVIWQQATLTGLSIYMTNTDAQGGSYAAPVGVVPAFTLYDTLYHSFESGDLRKANWVTPTELGGKNYYVVSKYKLRGLPSGASTGNEYNVIVRLAEQYLIRAEARARQGNLGDAVADVDSVRSRAGLSMLDPAISQADLLLAIEKERRSELFAEWGHRWMDLKRTPAVTDPAGKTRADEVLGGMKPATWNTTDILYPIPDAQRIANPALTQNPGYTN
jgi:hypothetical protein